MLILTFFLLFVQVLIDFFQELIFLPSCSLPILKSHCSSSLFFFSFTFIVSLFQLFLLLTAEHIKLSDLIDIVPLVPLIEVIDVDRLSYHMVVQIWRVWGVLIILGLLLRFSFLLLWVVLIVPSVGTVSSESWAPKGIRGLWIKGHRFRLVFSEGCLWLLPFLLSVIRKILFLLFS